MKNPYPVPFLLLSIALYIGALLTPAILDHQNGVSGFFLLMYGAFGALMSPIGLIQGKTELFVWVMPWFANPLLYAIWITLAFSWDNKGPLKGSIVFGAAALFCSLDFLNSRSLPLDLSSGYVAKDVTLGIGYYLWVSSIVCSLVPVALSLLPRDKVASTGND